MVLTGSFALSPVIGLFCHRRLAQSSARNLMPASRHQDHTTSPSASAPFVKGASASTASRSNVRDDRETPLMWDGIAHVINVICISENQNILQKGLDRNSNQLGERPNLNVEKAEQELVRFENSRLVSPAKRMPSLGTQSFQL
jgi:hypothetical protein